MQSPRGLAGSIILVGGVIVALASGIVLNAGASEVIHLALGLSFLLFAAAVFDFRAPQAARLVAAAGIGVLALIFLAQAVADISRSDAIASVAYGTLGQSLEKLLGYVFLAWCVSIAWLDSTGWRRAVGILALLIVLVVEVFSFVVASGGGAPDATLKFLYLPVFIWLALESARRRTG